MVSKSGFERIGKGVNWDYHTDFGTRTSYNCFYYAPLALSFSNKILLFA